MGCLEFAELKTREESCKEREFLRSMEGLPQEFSRVLLGTGFPDGSVVQNPPAKQERRVRSLGQEDPLEKEMATCFRILAWEIPWTEEPGVLLSVGSQRIDKTETNSQTENKPMLTTREEGVGEG